jgi:cytochrome P450
MLRMDFTGHEYLRDPAAGLARLRAAGPVVEVRFPTVGTVWMTTISELAAHVLKDGETFTMRKDGTVAGPRRWMPGWIRTLANSMLTMDGPDLRASRPAV